MLFQNPTVIAQGPPVYLYCAWASDASGTGFTTTFDPNLDYIAFKISYTILTPVVGDFAGLWKYYRGYTGASLQVNSAVTDPTINDDSAHGYSVNSLWWNTATSSLFSCKSAAVGAAVWHCIYPGYISEFVTVGYDSNADFVVPVGCTNIGPYVAAAYAAGNLNVRLTHGIYTWGDTQVTVPMAGSFVGSDYVGPSTILNSATQINFTGTTVSPIKLSNGCKLHNLYFWYPNQTTDTVANIIAYPYTIYAIDVHGFEISNIMCPNPYRFITMKGAGYAKLSKIFGWPIFVGIYADELPGETQYDQVGFAPWFDTTMVGAMCEWVQANGTGFWFNGIATDVDVVDCSSDGYLYGIRIVGPNSIKIRKVWCEGDINPLHISSSLAGGSGRLLITDSTFAAYAMYPAGAVIQYPENAFGISIEDGFQIIIENTEITLSGGTGIYIFGSSHDVRLHHVDAFLCSRSPVAGGSIPIIYVGASCEDVKISDCTIDGVSVARASGIFDYGINTTVSDTDIRGVDIGAAVYADGSNCRYEGNRVRDCIVGFYLGPACSDVEIENNDVDATTPLIDTSAASASKFIQNNPGIDPLLSTGWHNCLDTFTYAGADDPTYTMTAPGDLTGKYKIKQKIKLTQATGGTKYFIVTGVSYAAGPALTTLTLYGGTDYDLVNEAITAPYFSVATAPQGFPTSKQKWMVKVVDAQVRTQASPVVGTWYNLNSIAISLPIGEWEVYYEVLLYAAGAGLTSNYVTLSTANNSESDTELTYLNALISNPWYLACSRRKIILVAAKTPYYLNSKTGDAGTSSIGFAGLYGNTIIRAISTYL